MRFFFAGPAFSMSLGPSLQVSGLLPFFFRLRIELVTSAGVTQWVLMPTPVFSEFFPLRGDLVAVTSSPSLKSPQAPSVPRAKVHSSGGKGLLIDRQVLASPSRSSFSMVSVFFWVVIFLI